MTKKTNIQKLYVGYLGDDDSFHFEKFKSISQAQEKLSGDDNVEIYELIPVSTNRTSEPKWKAFKL